MPTVFLQHNRMQQQSPPIPHSPFRNLHFPTTMSPKTPGFVGAGPYYRDPNEIDPLDRSRLSYDQGSATNAPDIFTFQAHSSAVVQSPLERQCYTSTPCSSLYTSPISHYTTTPSISVSTLSLDLLSPDLLSTPRSPQLHHHKHSYLLQDKSARKLISDVFRQLTSFPRTLHP